MRMKWTIRPGEIRPVTTALQTLMMQTREEPGCLGCSLSTELAGPFSLEYVEEWSTESDLQRQIQSDAFATLAELLEHATEPPAIEFLLPSGLAGIEYAERVRKNPA